MCNVAFCDHYRLGQILRWPIRYSAPEGMESTSLQNSNYKALLRLTTRDTYNGLATGSTALSCLALSRGNSWNNTSMYTCFCLMIIRRTHA